MFWKNIDLSNYFLEIELQNSIFLIDVLETLYEFKINGEFRIEIYKKNTNPHIKEIISRIDFIYYIQVELFEQVQEYCETHPKRVTNLRGFEDIPLKLRDIPVMETFYRCFNKVDFLNKTIDNIIYLKKPASGVLSA